jgi:regulator of replication initiation timing
MMNNNFQTNLKPVLQKIFVVLGKQDREQLESLCRTLSNLFSHMNFTSHLYFMAENLSEGMPQLEYIQKNIMVFLKENLFARFYVNFIHRVPLKTVKDIDYIFNYYYQPWKRSIRAFDIESNEHREAPRLVLLPVVVTDRQTDSKLLAGLFDRFNSSFLLPVLYLNTDTFFLTEDENLLMKAHKVYYGHSNSAEAAEIVSTICSQDILEKASPNVASRTVLMNAPCPAALIISARDGMVYSCMDAFRKKESLTNIYGEHVNTLMAQYDQYHKSNSDCLECRKQMVEWFSSLGLPKGI